MDKQLKDYLPFYLGCEYWTNNSQGELNHLTLPHVMDMCDRNCGVQLHLRPLSSMTEDEAKQLIKIAYPNYNDVEIRLFYKGYGFKGYLEFGIHETVMCFVYETFFAYPGNEGWLPLFSLQLDDEDSSFGWGAFQNGGKECKDSVTDNIPEQVKLLLSLQFDLFNLIAAGLAIDSSTVNK